MLKNTCIKRALSHESSTFVHVIFFFFNAVLHPFQDYFSSYETGQSVGGAKIGEHGEKHLAHPQAEFGLSQCCKCGAGTHTRHSGGMIK